MADLVVHFPWMHPVLAGSDLPQWVQWFDPGVPLSGVHPRWRPPTLPCTDEQVRRMVREFLQFAELFPKPADIQTYQAVGISDFYTDTTMDIVSQLTGGSADSRSAPGDYLRQAQVTLALAFFREEVFLGMQAQKIHFEQARDGFARALGLDLEDTLPFPAEPDEALFPRAHTELSWKNQLPYYLAFLPAGAALFISDPGVVQEVEACELEFVPCTVNDWELRCCNLNTAKVERLCGAQLELASDIRILANL